MYNRPIRPLRHRNFRSASPLPLCVESILNVDKAMQTFHLRKQTHGNRLDALGRELSDITPTEMAPVLRIIIRSLKSCGQLPEVNRTIRIPRSSGGYRELNLQDAAACILAVHALRVIEPYFERHVFLPGSIGFRPHRSTWHMFRALVEASHSQGELWITQADVRNAFASVNLEEALQGLVNVLGESFRNLLTALIRGNRARQDYLREQGLDTGDPFSPLVLNYRLQCVFDAPINGTSNSWQWYRYADNLFAIAPCRETAEAAGRVFQERFRGTEFSLHAESRSCLSSRGTTEILGLRVGRQHGDLDFCVPRSAVRFLDEQLDQCCFEEIQLYGNSIIRNWINAYAPACHVRQVCPLTTDVQQLADKHGLGDKSRQLAVWMRESHTRWKAFLQTGNSLRMSGTACTGHKEGG